MPGRLNFSQFTSVKGVYTRSLSGHLAPRYFQLKASVGRLAAFHQTLARLGITRVFADWQAAALLYNGRGAGKLVHACREVPPFDRLATDEQRTKNRFVLVAALDDAFSRRGMRIVISNDCPEIYFFMEEPNLKLFDQLGSGRQVTRERLSIVWHPNHITLIRYIRGNLPPQRTKQTEEHLKECPACAKEFTRLSAPKPPTKLII